MYGKYFSRIWFRIESKRRDLWLYAIKQLNHIIDKVDKKLRMDLDKLADDYNVVLLLGIEKYKDSVLDMQPIFYILARIGDREILKKLVEDLRRLLGDGWDNGRFSWRVIEKLPPVWKYAYGSKAEKVIRELKNL